MRSMWAVPITCILGLVLSSGVTAAQKGALSQLTGTDACISETGSGGECTEGVALSTATRVTVGPDGRNVYVTSPGSDAVAVFARDRRSGALRQLTGTDACVSDTGSSGVCTDGVGLDGALGVAVSPDGRNVYVGSPASDAVAVFARDRKRGALAQLTGTKGCVSETGSSGACAEGIALDSATGPAVSPDGRNVYVTAGGFDGAVAAFARDRRSGALTQLAGTDACVSGSGNGGDCAVGVALSVLGGLAVSPDGKNLYVASRARAAVAVFARDRRSGALAQLAGTDACVSDDGSGGACAVGVGLSGAVDVAVSPDGKNVYVASQVDGAVAVFARDRRSGALTQLAGTRACISDGGSGGDCTVGIALDGAADVAVSPDGKHVYVAAFDSDAVAVFARDRWSGALTQLASPGACVSETGSGGQCAEGVALDGASGVAASRDGKNVYVASGASSDAVAAFARGRHGRH